MLFIMLGYGWFLQSLTHMGAHAFYKRGIFLCAGIVLISRFGFQDIRIVAKRGEGILFFLCRLGVLMVPTFFFQARRLLFSQRKKAPYSSYFRFDHTFSNMDYCKLFHGLLREGG